MESLDSHRTWMSHGGGCLNSRRHNDDEDDKGVALYMYMYKA